MKYEFLLIFAGCKSVMNPTVNASIKKIQAIRGSNTNPKSRNDRVL